MCGTCQPCYAFLRPAYSRCQRDPAGSPTDLLSPRLDVQPLHADANRMIFGSQQWAYRNGPVM